MNSVCLMLNSFRPCPLHCMFFESNESSEMYEITRLEVMFKKRKNDLFGVIFFSRYVFSKSLFIVP